jgi:hypothetical protein
MSMRLGPWLKRQRRELVLAAIEGGCRTIEEIAQATGLGREVVREIRAKLILTGNAPRPKVGRPAALRARVQATVTHEPQTAAQIADALQANRDRLAHVLRDLERRGAVTRLVERTQSGAFLWTLREAPTQTP